jgi:non-heme chloroperoxidase
MQRAGGVELYFKDWGAGRPALFCHGNNLNSDCWENQLLELRAGGYRAIAYDRRGHGRSSEPVTHSTGAGDLARYLSKYGSQRVARTVLVAPATPCIARSDDNPNGIPQSEFDGWIAEMCEDRPKYYTRLAPAFFGPSASAEMTDRTIRMALTSSLLAATALVAAQATTDFRGDMAAFTMPTLIIQGSHDAAPLELTAYATHAAIPHSTVKIYDGAYHGLPITHYKDFNRDLLGFMSLYLEDSAERSRI